MTQNHPSRALTGFSKKKNDAGKGLRCDYLKSMGANLRLFVIKDWNYVHWSPFPAQRHIMYAILTFLFYTLDDDELTFSFLCFLFASILKLEICVVACYAWMQIWVTMTRVWMKPFLKHPSKAAFFMNMEERWIDWLWTFDGRNDHTPVNSSSLVPCLLLHHPLLDMPPVLFSQ